MGAWRGIIEEYRANASRLARVIAAEHRQDEVALELEELASTRTRGTA